MRSILNLSASLIISASTMSYSVSDCLLGWLSPLTERTEDLVRFAKSEAQPVLLHKLAILLCTFPSHFDIRLLRVAGHWVPWIMV